MRDKWTNALCLNIPFTYHGKADYLKLATPILHASKKPMIRPANISLHVDSFPLL